MSAPTRLPRRQIRAFDKAMAERLGLNLSEITDEFYVNFETDGDMTTVTVHNLTAWLPTDEVLAMFNGTNVIVSDGADGYTVIPKVPE